MKRLTYVSCLLWACAAASVVTGCGVSETAVAGAATAASRAGEAQAAQQTLQQVGQQLEAANQQAEAQRRALGEATP
ncbi:MAG: hypothetical protein REI09_03685 [Candidatus Dactylopiibacterium sp.]|nr:hypothetical protein [Candidatus Dactylopiibacterium sp.]